MQKIQKTETAGHTENTNKNIKKMRKKVVLTIATQANKKWYLGQADLYILEMLAAQVRQTKPTCADPRGMCGYGTLGEPSTTSAVATCA